MEKTRRRWRSSGSIIEPDDGAAGHPVGGHDQPVPVSYNGNTDWMRFVGQPYNGEHNEVNERDVSADYFKTIGAKLLRGRYFRDDEDDSKPRVAIINEALARKYFPGEDPIGKRVGDDGLTPESMRTIVGVVENVREGPLDEEIWPAEYYPDESESGHLLFAGGSHGASGAAMLPALAAAMRRIDPRDRDTGRTDDDRSGSRNSPSAYMHRSAAWLVGGFAALARCWGWWDCTAWWLIRWARERGRSACAWRWGRSAARSTGWF